MKPIAFPIAWAESFVAMRAKSVAARRLRTVSASTSSSSDFRIFAWKTCKTA